jgi:exopolyphosphatase / guanosine-5'-triphosphate,3'-diphosphate pyrophosphatase
MSRRVGAVDIGTNSTRLLVADVSASGGIAEVERLLEITRLGDRVDAERRLTGEGIARVRAALERYAARAAVLGAEHVLAVATSAVRDAENGREFLAEVADAYGFVPRLLTGEEEAEMTYRGVCSRQAVGAGTLICDIGGGSTELILGGPDGVHDRASLDIGCVRLSERHLHTDPPANGELGALRAEAAAALPTRLTGAARDLVGVAGTVTTLATIDMGLEFEIPEAIDGHRLPAEAVERLLGELAALPLAKRRLVRGLMPERAPTIVAGAVILSVVVAATGVDAVVVSERDILHGAVLAAASTVEPGNPKERESS